MQIITLPNGESLIGLTLDEYNEFLILKGKYEELKNQKQDKISWEPCTYPWTAPTLTKTTDPLPESPYKITCSQ